MTKLFWISPCLALTACATTVPTVRAAGPAMAAGSCNPGNYTYMIGRPVSDSREITDREYRLALSGVAAARADRVTLFYDPQTQRITDIRCG